MGGGGGVPGRADAPSSPVVSIRPLHTPFPLSPTSASSCHSGKYPLLTSLFSLGVRCRCQCGPSSLSSSLGCLLHSRSTQLKPHLMGVWDGDGREAHGGHKRGEGGKRQGNGYTHSHLHTWTHTKAPSSVGLVCTEGCGGPPRRRAVGEKKETIHQPEEKKVL